MLGSARGLSELTRDSLQFWPLTMRAIFKIDYTFHQGVSRQAKTSLIGAANQMPAGLNTV